MISRFTLLFLTAALAVPGVAAAKPGARDFQRTFPVASRLCNAVAEGHAPKRLQKSEAQITTACDSLHAAYDAAVSAAGEGRGRVVRRAYRQAIQTARKAFWTTVDGLRGNASQRPHRPQHDEPVQDEQTDDESVSDEPVVDEPVLDDTTGDEPAGDEPAGDDESLDS